MESILNLIIIISIVILTICGLNYINNTKENFINEINNNQINKLQNSTVLIKNYMEVLNINNPTQKIEVGMSTGTGFFINSTDILTNYHVISNYKSLSFSLPNVSAENYECDVISIYPTLDVALLRVKPSSHYSSPHFLTLSNDINNSNQGKNAYAVGYPLQSASLKITSGEISGIQDGFLQMQTPVNPGNSGGPLIIIDDNNEIQVVGIIFATLLFADSVGFSIPIEYITNLLESMKLGNEDNTTYIIHKPSLGITYSNTSYKYIDLLENTNVKSGITINEIMAHSPLKDYNVNEGDVIYNIDNININNIGQMVLENNKIYTLDEYFLFKNPNSTITIKYISKDTLTIQDPITITLENKQIGSIKEIYYPFDKVDWFEYIGFTFMNLTADHILDPTNLYTFEMKELCNLSSITKGRVILTHKELYNGTNTDLNNILTIPIIIKQINGKDVFNIDDVKKSIASGGEILNGHTVFTMLTDNNVYYVYDINE